MDIYVIKVSRTGYVAVYVAMSKHDVYDMEKQLNVYEYGDVFEVEDIGIYCGSKKEPHLICSNQ